MKRNRINKKLKKNEINFHCLDLLVKQNIVIMDRDETIIFNAIPFKTFIFIFLIMLMQTKINLLFVSLVTILYNYQIIIETLFNSTYYQIIDTQMEYKIVQKLQEKKFTVIYNRSWYIFSFNFHDFMNFNFNYFIYNFCQSKFSIL